MTAKEILGIIEAFFMSLDHFLKDVIGKGIRELISQYAG